ncbi:PLP-dependent aminotransferase family protein [Deinococcus sonorensis]|uniref:PLP-dependent aminotransferase family protein n=2 Tax=Deinococcus sonorensis TaxID=309891 RepID=A0AAU7UA83_9DEIO
MDHPTAPVLTLSTGPLRSGPELPFQPSLQRDGAGPLAAQLAQQLRTAIQAGRLPQGTALPSSRSLASQLGVARGTVVEAYSELTLEGYLGSRGGSRTTVQAARLPAPVTAPLAPGWLPDTLPVPTDAPLAGTLDFRLGQPTLQTLDRRAWQRSWQHAARQLPPNDYGDPAGEQELRAALAAYLGRSRGLPARPEQLIVTGGAVQGIGLIARGLVRPGDRVTIENPGYRLARTALAESGAELLSVPVDQDGLVVEQLPAARLVYVTPSHQYPLAVRMSAARRLALLAWAEQHDALIIEDDYDSEYRYGAPPLPTLASLDRSGRVLYLGTLSKVLTPALRLGYLMASPALLPALLRQKVLADSGSAWPVQVAVTHLLQQGDLDRHIRRTRRHYRMLSALLHQQLAPLAPLARLGGIEAGLHACLHLSAPLKAQQIAAVCLERGVRVSTLDSYTQGPAPQALLLGYGGLTVRELLEGAAVVVWAVRQAAGLLPSQA